MKKAHVKPLIEAILNPDICIKLVLEMWNDEAPHFGGSGPHRYDGSDKECCYCIRPKDWKPVNAGYWTSELQYGDAEKVAEYFQKMLTKAEDGYLKGGN